MPLILNGSTGISGADGTAATPAVQGTDTNTGMFFPAADQIAFAEGGVEAMRIDASGNVGIGTTAPAARLHVNGSSGSPQTRMGTSAGYYEVNAFDGNPVYMVVNGTNHTGGVIGTQSNTPFTFFTNNTERARITSGGDFQFNSGYGSVATAYGCRAWVNFNGTGTVTIRASGGVSSVSDNGVGNYGVNFAFSMPDTNYCPIVTVGPDVNNGADGYAASYFINAVNVYYILPGTAFYDNSVFQVAVFR